MQRLQFFQRGASGGINFSHRKKNYAPTILVGYLFLIIAIFVVMALRLFHLTIVKGNYYRRLSEENRIRQLTIEAERGKIIDRKGMTIAQNYPADTAKNLSRLTSSRQYDWGSAASPIVGYIQNADAKDIREDNCLQKLREGDHVGKKGAEKLYECTLRGRNGKKLIEVDAHGNYLKTLSVIPPENGTTVQLALDIDLQKKAYELLKDKIGTIIVLKPQTGEIVVLATNPSYDPQNFENENQSEVESYLKDENKPLFNRATEGTYPPGSLFKLVIATGALEEKKIDEKTIFEDTGILHAGPLTFGNWYFLQYGKTEGSVDIVKAIKRSNDIFFYQTGARLGVDGIKKWAQILGYGKKTESGLDEAEGIIPSPFWKEENLKDQWYLGDTYNLSIGQGYMLVTPLQVALSTLPFANGGYLCAPQLLKSQSAGTSPNTQNCRKIAVSNKTLSLIREGMKEACAPGGTGWPLFNFKVGNNKTEAVLTASSSGTASVKKIDVACKTGTAESHAESGLPHAWFTAYAPADNPEIAITVLIEDAGQGSDVAAPLAKEIFKSYFERNE